MSKIPKVVSFDRPAEYLHHRAMLNRRGNRSVDALELLRRAVETSPDNSQYRLDLAEMYYDMGSYAQSTRLLLDLLSEEDAPSECYYGLALNQASMGDIPGARRTIDLYKRAEPEWDKTEAIKTLVSNLDEFENAGRPAGRRLNRASRIARRASEAMKADMPERACRLFEKSLDLASGQHDMRALYAMALFMVGRRDEARAQAERACRGLPPSVRVLCVCAQVFHLLEDDRRARELIEAAERERPEGIELQLMVYAVGDLDMDDKTAELARLALQEVPYCRELLHIRAVALKRTGASDAEAGRYWERILRIDPEDSVAQYYAEAAAQGTLGDAELDYGYQVPYAECMRRMKRLADILAEDFDGVRERWAEDRDFRRLVRWGVTYEVPMLSRAALTVLATVDDPDAASVLREMLLKPEIPKEFKLDAAMLARAHGRPLSAILPAAEENTGAELIDTDALMDALPVGERQLVRLAYEVLDREYDIRALPTLVTIWTNYRRARGVHGDPLKRIEPAAAALAFYFLYNHWDNTVAPDIGKLSKQFRCSLRSLEFCARVLVGVQDRQKRTEE